MMQNNEEILVSCRRFDREAPGQIGGSTLGSVEGERVAVEGGVKGIGGDRGKLRDEGAVGWGSLCAFVFPGLAGRGKERESSEAGWGGESVVWTRCLSSAGRGDQRLWRERGEGTCGLGWRLVVGGSCGYIHGRGHGGKSRGRVTRSSDAGRRQSEREGES